MSPPSSQTSFSAQRAASTSTTTTAPRKPLSIDLSSLPPLSQPTPPSNTLIITELHDLKLFQPSSLDAIKSKITATAPLNSFSPLPSFRRIICSFLSIDDAIQIRQLLDGEPLLGKNVRTRIYFGEPTPVQDIEEARKSQLLEAPHSQKLFFISPPPSPPHGWMMRNEEPPNKEVHATDLADALDKLGHIDTNKVTIPDEDMRPETPISPVDDVSMGGIDGNDTARAFGSGQRSRSGTLIYHPEHHGKSPNLPAVMVEDTTIDADVSDSEMEPSPVENSSGRIPAHTPRPPVELME